MTPEPLRRADPYTVERLAADVEAAVASEADQARLIPRLEPLLARFLAAGTLPERYCQPVAGRVASDH